MQYRHLDHYANALAAFLNANQIEPGPLVVLVTLVVFTYRPAS